jgi:hypothetical protein
MFLTWRTPAALKVAGHPALRLLVYRTGNQDSAGGGQRLQARGNVDPIAEQRGAFPDDIAEMHANPQRHATVRKKRLVLFVDRLLDGLCATNGIDGAGELRHQAIADTAEFPAVEFLDEPIEDRAANVEGGECSFVVHAHQAAVAHYVSCHNRGDLSSVLRHGPPGSAGASIALGYLDIA